ncbi:MAG TPA: SDR family NAD(P)-dependent oxidoreductase [Candidatus Polarisedimenticolaceae bacterium]|nr:SDR family NAD(P)-dependent oxidoreductase [Candidatus Polarisedimenticolaceae bacterium]
MRFAGRLILITGASAGIGRAAARAFAAEGARVIALARAADRLATLVAEAGPRVVPFVADVTDAAALEAAFAGVLREHGVPDVVVANAGIGLDALFVNTSDELLRRVLEVNVLGVARTVRPFLPGMLERGSGRILLISSIVGKRGTPYYSAYSASKFALHGLADSLRAELVGSGVSVGLVCPSSTTTEFQQHLLRSGPGQKRARPRRHSAESVAQAILSMAASRRRERVLGLESKLLVALDLVAPGLADRLLARTLRS